MSSQAESGEQRFRLLSVFLSGFFSCRMGRIIWTYTYSSGILNVACFNVLLKSIYPCRGLLTCIHRDPVIHHQSSAPCADRLDVSRRRDFFRTGAPSPPSNADPLRSRILHSAQRFPMNLPSHQKSSRGHAADNRWKRDISRIVVAPDQVVDRPNDSQFVGRHDRAPSDA